jgi:hypothetical protein
MPTLQDKVGVPAKGEVDDGTKAEDQHEDGNANQRSVDNFGFAKSPLGSPWGKGESCKRKA